MKEQISTSPRASSRSPSPPRNNLPAPLLWWRGTGTYSRFGLVPPRRAGIEMTRHGLDSRATSLACGSAAISSDSSDIHCS
jgi:hypothetical protein